MKKIILFLCIITAFSFPLFAAEEDTETGSKKIDGSAVFQPVRKGDKFMKIGLSLGIPLFNTSLEKFAIPTHMYPGGAINAAGHSAFSFIRRWQKTFILPYRLRSI